MGKMAVVDLPSLGTQHVFILIELCFHCLGLFGLEIYIYKSGMLKSPTIIVCGEMCALSFTKVSLTNVVALAYGAQIFRIESSSWQIVPQMSMQCPSLSFLITLGWKSILFDIRMATPACFLEPFAWKIVFHPFTLKQYLSVFVLGLDFLNATICWGMFTQPVCYLCLFTEELSPLMLRETY